MRTKDTWTGIALRLLALFAVFAAANVLTYFGSDYFEKERNYRAMVQGVRDHPRTHVLFVGDSHTAHPLNAYLDDSPATPAYSVAFGGDSAREAFAKFRHVLELAPQIDTLVVPAEPHMFGRGRVNSSNRSFADAYFIVARDGSGLRTGWPSALLDQIPLLNDDFLQYLRKLITARSSLHKEAVDTDAVTVAATSAWEAFSESKRAQKARETGAMDHQEIGEHREPYEWYGRILELACERKIRVIGVRYPVHPEYAASTDAAHVAAVDRFLREAGISQIVDLRAMFSGPTAFDDPDHVKASQAPQLLEVIGRAAGMELVVAQPLQSADNP